MSELINESLQLGDDISEPAGCDDITFDLDTPRDGIVLDEPRIITLEHDENKSDVPRIMITEPSSVCLPDELIETNGIDEPTKNVECSNNADSEIYDKDERDDGKQCKMESVSVTYDVDEKGDKQEASSAEIVCDIDSTTHINEKPELTENLTDELSDNIVNNKDDNEGDDFVTLDNIIVQDKTGSDSDSEFDFELPTSTTTDANICPVSNQSVKQILETNVSPIDEPPALVESVKVETQPTTVSQKPIAVIKPTTVSPVSVYTHQESNVVTEDNSVLEAAQAEWENVTTVQAGYGNTSTGVSGVEPTVVSTVKPMSEHELIQNFKEEDFTSVKSGITSHVERHGFAAFVNFLFGPPKLHHDLIEDRDRVFCIAASQLENNNETHMRTLQTIYKCLTGSKFDCPRVGGHWEEIGFQGTDPSTDLRGTGLLGLLNIIHLLKDPKKIQLGNDIYRLSLHPTQNFPFCIMGINMSRITLQTLREGMLNKECNRRRDVFGVVNDFYSALYLQLYQVWKRRGKTIADSGFVIKEIEVMSKKNPRDVLKNLEDYLNKKTVVSSGAKTGVMGQEDFVNICDDK